MSVDEKYALNWSSHANHLKQAFHMILEASDFVDVTLSCEGGKKVKAHRVILSACSTFFYDILKDNPSSHPTIVLRDIKYSNIKYLLEFMYCGEVQVPTENFGSFLQAAEILQVSGLNGNDSPPEKPKTKAKDDVAPVIEAPKPASLKLSNAPGKRKSFSGDDVVQHKKKKDSDESESEEYSGSDTKDDEGNDTVSSLSVENISNIQKLLANNIYFSKDENPECECPVCAEKFTSIFFLKQHVPFHLGETKCPMCPRVLNRVDLLKKHLLTNHKMYK